MLAVIEHSVTAAPASAEPPGGALAVIEHLQMPGFVLLALASRVHHNFEIGRWLVTARPSCSMPGRLEKKGASITSPLDQEITNQYNENEALNCARAGVTVRYRYLSRFCCLGTLPLCPAPHRDLASLYYHTRACPCPALILQ